MKITRTLWLACTSLGLLACGGDDSDDGGTGGDECSEGGTAEIALAITGLRAGVEGSVTLSGPDGDMTLRAPATIDDAASGDYVITAETVSDTDPVVRTLYVPSIDIASFCVGDGKMQAVSVTYDPVPTSNKLWILNDGPDASLLGYASVDLEASGSPDAATVIDAPTGTDLAFDRDGNVWTIGPTTVDAPLARYSAADFASSGEKELDRAIEVAGIRCIPGMRALAFDPDGNLWISACGGEVMRLGASMLETDGTELVTRTPDVVFSGLSEENNDIAFDEDGNLWVADDARVARFDASRLGTSDGDAPDRSLALRTSGDTQDLNADYLTFDTSGNLWVTDFGGNFLAKIPASELAGSGEETVITDVSLVLSVSALLNRPAFDESGGLWISYSAGRVARIAPADLEISTGAGDPTAPDVLLEGGEIANTENVAFFPAPLGLPLYHSR